MGIKTELLAYGIFEVETDAQHKVFHPNSPKEYFYLSNSSYPFLKQTYRIPLALGTAFGIRFQVSGAVEDQAFDIRILHPEIENPDTRFTFVETFHPSGISNVLEPIAFFIFEQQWEMVPGFWTFQILNKNNVLLEKEFEVYAEAVEEEEEKFFFDM